MAPRPNRTDTHVPRTAPSRRDAAATRARVLAAAGEVFARDGYRGASLREISARAAANLGAVRYYFGSKLGLYREVVLDAYDGLLASEPPPRVDDLEPRAAIRAWVHFFLRMVLLRSRHPFITKIMARELADPSEVFDDLVERVFRPVRMQLQHTVAALTGERADSDAIAHKANHLVLLCMQFEMARPFLEKVGPGVPDTAPAITALADRVSDLVLDGLAGGR